MPRCLIIAGPNGAGKTTFARTFLPRESVKRFVNADLLAAGLSPLDPPAAQLAAGRLFLAELDRHAAMKEDFAFETTLSGLTYIARLEKWKKAGYRIELFYLKLSHVRLSLERVAARVRSGGHDVPEADIRRRFPRSWVNFKNSYQPLADATWVFDVSGSTPIILSSTS
jgi:predicted ABC-type ATPase